MPDAPTPRTVRLAGRAPALSAATLARVSDVIAALRPDPGTETDQRHIAAALTALQARSTALGASPPCR